MNDIIKKLSDWGCDTESALARVIDDEEFLLLCICQVADDPAFDSLGEALNSKNANNAFEAAHTLKGIIGNTGLTPLYSILAEMVEPLRNGSSDNLMDKYELLMTKRAELNNIIMI